MDRRKNFRIFLILALLSFGILSPQAQEPMEQERGAGHPLSPEQLLALQTAGGVEVSPDGSEYIFSVSAQRGPNEAPGGPHVTFYRGSFEKNGTIPLFENGLEVSAVQYSSDGATLGFLYEREKGPRQVWAMATGGGEWIQLTHEPGGVSYFRWQPGQRAVAILSQDPVTEKEETLKKKGYDFIFYEENLRKNHLTLIQFDEQWLEISRESFPLDGHPWDFEFNEQGTMMAATVSPENLIDQRYMFRRIYLIDAGTGEIRLLPTREGKLGNYAFSPDGTRLAYAAALDINDHAVSQAYVADLGTGQITNLTPEKFRGHVEWVGWYDNDRLLCYTGEGVYPALSLLPLDGDERKVILEASEQGIIFSTPSFSQDRKHFIFTGSTPSDASNLYSWNGKGKLRQLTGLNPALKSSALGEQELIRYTARDGQEIEGLLIHPVGYQQGTEYPLIVYVHGGPESHHSNGWLSSYSTPGQVMAGKGYLVLYLNYRASTGYGVPFAMEGFMDPAGKEFDDIADGIEWAVREKGADPDRVGMAGGSYGGYASAWFATYYTRYVKAVCMFVGISDVISKRGTTDIPWEERYVHSGKPLEEQWQMNLERSPVYWAHQSKTATLIYGGASDTRVHPSQSLELYRRMKMNGHPAVRLVQYPGEGHGNRNQVGRIDVLYRQIGWLDWYVKESHPLEGSMPPLDISDQYGLDWEF